MPWKPSDARRHDRKANTAKKRRQWAHVANSELRRTGDEGRAVRAANSVIKRAGRTTHRKKKGRHSWRGKRHRQQSRRSR